MMKFKIFIVVAILNTFAMQANAQEPSTPGPCVDSGGLRLICDFNGIPEDLVIVPDTGWVLASVFSREDTTALYLVDSQSKTTYSLYSPEIGDNRFDRQAYPNCPGAPDLSNIDTHGLSIRPQVGNPGIHTLYAVSHGAREAVEVFELDATADMPQISWIGCVLMPDGLDANDVSSMQDGSILVTVLMHPGDSFEDLLAGQAESIAGLREWRLLPSWKVQNFPVITAFRYPLMKAKSLLLLPVLVLLLLWRTQIRPVSSDVPVHLSSFPTMSSMMKEATC